MNARNAVLGLAIGAGCLALGRAVAAEAQDASLPAFVQEVHKKDVSDGSATPRATFDSPKITLTAGHLAVVVWTAFIAGTPTTVTVTDTAGNEWDSTSIPQAASTVSHGGVVGMAFCSNLKGNLTNDVITVKFSPPAVWVQCPKVLEYRNVATSRALDATATGMGTKATVTSGPFSTDTATELIVAATVDHSEQNTWTAGTIAGNKGTVRVDPPAAPNGGTMIMDSVAIAKLSKVTAAATDGGETEPYANAILVATFRGASSQTAESSRIPRVSGPKKPAGWPKWRGANGDCVVADGKTRVAVWGPAGPLKIWESPPIPARILARGVDGGCGSVVVSGERVYVFATPTVAGSVATGTTTTNTAATNKRRSDDTIYCLNAADGSIVWKRSYPGTWVDFGRSCTPCVADGRVYVLGEDSMLYCLSAKDGAEVWTAQPAKGWRNSSFVVVDGLAIVQNDVLMALDAATGARVWTCAEARGDMSTPTPWVKDGKTYLICCNNEGRVWCVDAKTGGKALWKLVVTSPQSPGHHGSVAVNGDDLVVFTGNRLVGYRLGLDKAEPRWKTDVGPDRGASPLIYKKRVYLGEMGRTLCLNLEDGRILWDGKTDSQEFSSAVLADDKLVVVGNNSLLLLNAAPEKFELLAKASLPVALYTTPAIANGRMYVRLQHAIGCFDLSQSAPAAR